MKIYEKYVKRGLDIVLSAAAITIFSPVYGVIAVVVRKQMGSPVLFHQERIGKDEKIFKLYKFRSMTNEEDKNGSLLPEKDRLTKFGIKLRSTSLDELPELFMILKGDMSFVGPRPQPAFYGPYYKPEERKAHKVLPGLISPDSMLKEVQCSWEKQFEIENYYADHVSFPTDVKVILDTFIILYKRIKYNYGADDRPMLHVYRSNMDVPGEVKKNDKKRESKYNTRIYRFCK